MEKSRSNANADAEWLAIKVRLVCVAGVMCLAAFTVSINVGRFSDFTAWFLSAQDRWLLLTQFALLSVCIWQLNSTFRRIVISERACILLVLLIIPFCYLGHWWALSGYDLSRDEQMATFDAHIYARGLLVQPLSEPWRTHEAALNTLFILPAMRPVAWVSTYLPINAALRAMMGAWADPALTGPVLTAIGAFALWKCARRLWPDDPESWTLAVLLYIASGQVLFAGMSAYAMAGHLALNLLWLWLFLLGRRIGDVGALLIGCFATGLHQPLFHPLFVVPFIVLLIAQRDWQRVVIFIAGYAMICFFWLGWPDYISTMVETGHPAVKPADANYWTRLQWVLETPPVQRGISMSANLLRFAAWQPILLLPLFGCGLLVARRNAMAAALAAAAILPTVVMGILLPDQGQGFGYRYLHGVIGATILVAVFGWRHVVAQEARWRPLVARSLGAGLFVLLPIQSVMAHLNYASFAEVDRRIAGSDVDYFIIGNDDAPMSNALMTNRADLTNRPLRLSGDQVNAELTRLICAKHASVGMPKTDFYTPINRYFSGGVISQSADRRIAKLGRQLATVGCRVIIVGHLSRS